MKSKLMFSLLTVSLLISACSSAGSTRDRDNEDGKITNNYKDFRSLADYLIKVPGVNVRGSGNNITVTIRGVSSFQSGNSPLYIVDGQAVGTNYARANNLINAYEIDYVNVLKGPDAAIYGVRGANGVIEIVTR